MKILEITDDGSGRKASFTNAKSYFGKICLDLGVKLDWQRVGFWIIKDLPNLIEEGDIFLLNITSHLLVDSDEIKKLNLLMKSFQMTVCLIGEIHPDIWVEDFDLYLETENLPLEIKGLHKVDLIRNELNLDSYTSIWAGELEKRNLATQKKRIAEEVLKEYIKSEYLYKRFRILDATEGSSNEEVVKNLKNEGSKKVVRNIKITSIDFKDILECEEEVVKSNYDLVITSTNLGGIRKIEKSGLNNPDTILLNIGYRENSNRNYEGFKNLWVIGELDLKHLYLKEAATGEIKWREEKNFLDFDATATETVRVFISMIIKKSMEKIGKNREALKALAKIDAL